jgi:hypothetical protein
MATFTIRGEHDGDCCQSKRILESLTQAGSYFLKHARWGCESGDHTACLDVEADCEEEVRLMVPPVLRGRAIITRTNQEVRAHD